MSANQSSPSVREHEPLSAGSGEGAFPTINSDDARPSRSGEGYGQSSGPALTSRQPLISFGCAYHDWLLGRTPDEPQSADYGLSDAHAESLRKEVRRLRNEQLGARAACSLLDQKPSTKGKP